MPRQISANTLATVQSNFSSGNYAGAYAAIAADLAAQGAAGVAIDANTLTWYVGELGSV